MVSEKENTLISKFLSLVLRHQPETIGIDLDENGWTDVNTLIEKSNANGVSFDFNVLKHIVDTNSKKRFSFDESFNRIRASQGHSVDIDLNYKSQKPPAILYHGTAEKFVTSILAGGLDKRQRHHVHLSKDIETALKVGQRHGKPVILEVIADQMSTDNFEFVVSDNGVWLTEHVPARYLRLYEQGKD